MRKITKTRALSLLALSVALASCTKPLVLSPPALIDDRTSFATAQPIAEEGSKDLADLQSLLDEATRIVKTEAFRENLVALGQPIAVAPFGERVSPETVYIALAGRDPAYTYVPTKIMWVDKGGNSNSGDGAGSLIRLTRDVQKNWTSGDLRKRSLAINSMAHELSHSLSRNPQYLDYVFIDRMFRLYWLHKSDAIASYTIGTVAQCTWLAEQEASVDIPACLERYGLRKFNSNA